jgi:hypothetical protein
MSQMSMYGQGYVLSTLVLAIGIAVSANAADVKETKTVGPYRVELHVLPAEPFFSKDEIAAKHVKEGMQVEGGTTPVPLNAPSHPNHHLVVHVFDQKSGQALTNAKVTLRFEPLDDKGKAVGASVEVPVVIMQAIGKGPLSTHYGNNVTMPAGRYQVTAAANGETGVFDVMVSDTPPGSATRMNM